MKNIIAVFLFFITTDLYAQTDIWVENFSYVDGTIAVTTGPTQWHTDIRFAAIVPPRDYFEVRSNLLEARDVDGEVLWLSEDIDISDLSYTNVSISFDLSETGRMEITDYVRGYYSLDDADSVLFAEQTDDITGGGPITLAVGGLTGSTVRITIAVSNNAGNERFRIDNVGVRQVGSLSSFASGNWDDGNNWSADGGSSACSCFPSAFTDVTIQSAHVIDLNVTASTNQLNVDGTLQWLGSGGTLTVFEDINISNGGVINRNGQKNGTIPK